MKKDKRTREDLLKEITKLKQQRSKLNVRIRKLTEAADAFVHYVITPVIGQGFKRRNSAD